MIFYFVLSENHDGEVPYRLSSVNVEENPIDVDTKFMLVELTIVGQTKEVPILVNEVSMKIYPDYEHYFAHEIMEVPSENIH